MHTLEILFILAIFLIFYTYLGYGIILYALVRIKRLFHSKKNVNTNSPLPEITLLIAAYNEEDFVDQKVENSFNLDYPKDKIHHIWVSDGSNDETNHKLQQYNGIKVLFRPERNGKIAAMNRAMKEVETAIVVFTDANTLLGKKSIRIIAELFSDPKVGCVSGEKRIFNSVSDDAASAGEGIYWKYESALKKLDAELNTAVGAAGELFAIRTELFNEVESDTLLDDFIISLRVAMKGYKIQYNPEAYAIETASANVKEELKRKIRIAAGGIQSVIRLWPLLNIFKYRTLSFQYISHRVLRWTLTPLALIVAFISNALIIDVNIIYKAFFFAQLLFYFIVFLGSLLQGMKLKFKLIFIPYYFFIMNYAVYIGFFRYLKKTQSVNWERAKRA